MMMPPYDTILVCLKSAPPYRWGVLNIKRVKVYTSAFIREQKITEHLIINRQKAILSRSNEKNPPNQVKLSFWLCIF